MIVKLLDNVRVALDGLRSNKLRSALTMLGMTIGVAAVIMLVSLGQGVEGFIVKEFSQFGSNWIQIVGTVSNTSTAVGQQTQNEAVQAFIPLTDSDVRALSDPFALPQAERVAPALILPEDVIYQGEHIRDLQIAGTTPDYMDIFDVHAELGRDLIQEDIDSAARVALIGLDAADLIFQGAYPVGRSIRIGTLDFRVIGVLENFNTTIDQNNNKVVLIPITTAWKRMALQRTISGDYPVTAITVQALDTQVVKPLVTDIKDILRTQHKLKPDDKDDFQIFALTDILDTLNAILGLLTVFLAVIAGISLLVGGIGIMNIMLVTVTERTREIGLRKAVGARRPDILTQFLTESIVLALVGGLIGTAIAIGFSALVTAVVPDLTVEVQPSSIVMATMITISTGAFFGAFPANRAASLNPIDALRHE